MIKELFINVRRVNDIYVICFYVKCAGFQCHDQGASSILYAPQHQLLISAGKKGYAFIFDLRQRRLMYRSQLHDSPIRCLALDPHEEFFVTGAADGDIKVLLFSFLVLSSKKWYSFEKSKLRNIL